MYITHAVKEQTLVCGGDCTNEIYACAYKKRRGRRGEWGEDEYDGMKVIMRVSLENKTANEGVCVLTYYRETEKIQLVHQKAERYTQK